MIHVALPPFASIETVGRRLFLAFVLATQLGACASQGSLGGACEQDRDCPGAQVCEEGRCRSAGSDGGPDGASRDGGMDAAVCPTGCDGGVCIGGSCCPAENACGDACCTGAETCSFGQCVTPGEACADSTDCAPDQFCDRSFDEEDTPPVDAGTCRGGVTLRTGQCLPRPPTCETDEPPTPGEPLTCLPSCEFSPPPGPFSPVLKAHWDEASIMMSPIVIQLDDDDCDGEVTERDIPEIVFVSFPNRSPERGTATYVYGHATLHAISLVDGTFEEKWSFTPETDAFKGSSELAAGNFDGEPGNEIAACTATNKLRAVAADGSPLWTADVTGCRVPAIGDVDGDGQPEIVTETNLVDGATGVVEATFPSSRKALADLDRDGNLDVVGPSAVWRADGTLMADTGLGGSDLAIGDFDGDGVPEVTSANNRAHVLNVWQYDASATGNFRVVRTGIDIHGMFENDCPEGSAGSTRGGGPPTIADFNGDGTPDVAIAGGIGYAVVDGTKILDPEVAANDTLLWLQDTTDCSSAATGSSIFDFNGDGQAEVVYSDEHYFRIYAGTDGEVLFRTCNTTGTLIEYPLVADVDADGHADVVVVSNDYSGITCPEDGSKQRGVRVFGDIEGKWVRTRRVWNQHSYHVTNVEEDGTIPRSETPNWSVPRLNNYRQNVQPAGEFLAPDLVLTLTVECLDGIALQAVVRNVGAASVPAGVVVGFYEGDPATGGTRLGEAHTRRALAPAEAEAVRLPVESLPEGDLYALADDTSEPHAWQECRTANNTSGPVAPICPGPE